MIGGGAAPRVARPEAISGALPGGHPLTLPSATDAIEVSPSHAAAAAAAASAAAAARDRGEVPGPAAIASAAAAFDAAVAAANLAALEAEKVYVLDTYAHGYDGAEAPFDDMSELEAGVLEAGVLGGDVAAASPPAFLATSQAVGLGLSCGGISGMLSRAVVHPFDTLRVLQSVSSTAKAAEVVAESSAEVGLLTRLSTASEHWMQTASRAATDGRYALRSAYHNWHLGPKETNPLYDMSQLRQSLKILYRGYSLSVFGAQPVYAAYFGAYECVKMKMLERFPDASPSAIQIASGFFAECVAVIFWNPWEVVRQRMQLGEGSGPARTFVQTTQDIVKESGVRGLYAGIGGYLALWGTFSPLMFVIYERAMAIAYPPPPPMLTGEGQRVGPQRAESNVVPSLGVSFLAGSFAGIASAAITSPFDVVKTRMQTQTPTTMLRYTSVFHGLQEIYTHEGPKALFRGVMARSLNQGLATGIMMGTYGVMRASLARKLGWLPDTRSADGGWASQVAGSGGGLVEVSPSIATGSRPVSRMRLQPWLTTSDEYHESARLTVVVDPNYPPPPPPPLAPPKKEPQDHGFIRPITRWD